MWTLKLLFFGLVFKSVFTDDICGRNVKLVVGGEPVEQICDRIKEWRDCKEIYITHVTVKHKANGACHCDDGLYRHSNGSCMTLRECGFFLDESPCSPDERIVFNFKTEKTCDGSTYSDHFNGKANFLQCFYAPGNIRSIIGTTHERKQTECISIDECRERNPQGNVTAQELLVRVRSLRKHTPPIPKLDRCGLNEVMLADGPPTEQLCDIAWRGCEPIMHVDVRRTALGTCHCVSGRYRHSNGSCLTLRECGYPYDETPCAANDRTVLGNFYEKKCGTEYKYFGGTPKKIHCHCPDELVRHNASCIRFDECRERIFPGFVGFSPPKKVLPATH